MSSSLTAIAMSHHPFEIFAHHRALREHAGQQEREKYGEPAVDRKARIYVDRMLGSRNSLYDRADAQTEELQRKQHPGDRLQTVRIYVDEPVNPANRLQLCEEVGQAEGGE